MRFGKLKFWKVRPGVMGENWCWCCHDTDGYLYIHESLPRLLLQIATEWRQPKHFVGYE